MNMSVHVIIYTYTHYFAGKFQFYINSMNMLMPVSYPLASTKSDQWLVVLDRYWNKKIVYHTHHLLFSIPGLSKAAGGPPSAAPSSTSSRVTRTSSLNTSKPTSREAKISTGTKEQASKEPALKRRTGVTGSSRRTSEGRTPRTSRGEPSYFL